MKNELGRRNGGRYTIKQMLKLGGKETGHIFFMSWASSRRLKAKRQ